MQKSKKFTEREAVLALSCVTLWIDDDVSDGEEKSFMKLIEQENYKDEEVKEFHQKWDELDYLDDVFDEAIKVLNGADFNTKVKAVAWMFEIANEGGAGSRNDEETDMISNALADLQVTQQDAINYYEKLIP